MGDNLEAQIRKLQEFYWSDADPQGRGFVNLAELYRRTGEYAEAHRLLRDGLARHARMASGHVVLGWVFLDQGSATEAETAFRAALAVDPENVGALKGLADLLLKRNQRREALEVHRKLHRLNPLDPDVPLRLQELESGLSAADEVTSISSTAQGEPAVWDDGEAVAEALDWGGASIQPDDSSAAEVGFPGSVDGGAERVESPEMAVPLPTAPGRDALVTRTMGEIYLRQGLLEEARTVFEALLEESPEDELLRTRLREVEEAETGGEPAGDFARARFPEPAPATIPTLEDEESETAVPILELAPGEVTPIGDLAPDGVVAIQDLAPDVILSVADLAPDLIVFVEDLAPEVIIPVEDLAPDNILPVEALAPGEMNPPHDTGPEEGDGGTTLDDFEAWLDRLP